MDVDNDDSYSETSESLASIPGETITIGDLPTTLEWIYDTGEFSDFTVILGDTTVKLHKSVVCGQSPVLRRAVLDGKDEIVPYTWRFEKNTEVYGAVFRFMYGLKYDNPIVSSCMSFHAQVYQLAVCLGVLELRNLAKRNFKKCIKTAWDADEFLKVLGMAKFFFPGYCISACREHIDELSNKPEFEIVLRRGSELARELTIMLGKSLRSYCCPQCNQTWSLDCSLSSPSYCPTCGHHEQDWDKFGKSSPLNLRSILQ